MGCWISISSFFFFVPFLFHYGFVFGCPSNNRTICWILYQLLDGNCQLNSVISERRDIKILLGVGGVRVWAAGGGRKVKLAELSREPEPCARSRGAGKVGAELLILSGQRLHSVDVRLRVDIEKWRLSGESTDKSRQTCRNQNL